MLVMWKVDDDDDDDDDGYELRSLCYTKQEMML